MRTALITFVVLVVLAVVAGLKVDSTQVNWVVFDLLAIGFWGASFFSLLVEARRARARVDVEILQGRAESWLASARSSAATYLFLIGHEWRKGPSSPANFDEMVAYSKRVRPEAESIVERVGALTAGDTWAPLRSDIARILEECPDAVLQDQLGHVLSALGEYEAKAVPFRARTAAKGETDADYVLTILAPYFVALAVATSTFAVLGKV